MKRKNPRTCDSMIHKLYENNFTEDNLIEMERKRMNREYTVNLPQTSFSQDIFFSLLLMLGFQKMPVGWVHKSSYERILMAPTCRLVHSVLSFTLPIVTFLKLYYGLTISSSPSLSSYRSYILFLQSFSSCLYEIASFLFFIPVIS